MAGIRLTATATFTPGDIPGVVSRIVPQLAGAVNAGTQAVYEESQVLVPVDTGELKASGHVVEAEDDGQAVSGQVVYDAEHAAFLEFGTGIRGAASAGAGADVSYSPTWPGMAAQPYARPGLDSARPAILDAFGKIRI